MNIILAATNVLNVIRNMRSGRGGGQNLGADLICTSFSKARVALEGERFTQPTPSFLLSNGDQYRLLWAFAYLTQYINADLSATHRYPCTTI